MARWVYRFHEGSMTMRNLLGGKGCNLAEMINLRIPTLQGFTVTAEACTEYYNCDKQIFDEIQNQIFETITWMGSINSKKFGDTGDPLLVSVRSGARISMLGMMDTILNLGLNSVAAERSAKKTGSPRFAYDFHHRFIQMHSDAAMEVPKSYFGKIIDVMKEAKGVHFDTELTADDLKELTNKSKTVYKEAMNGEEFLQDLKEQLMGAVKAVSHSWDNPRAVVYHRMNDVLGDWGTVVNIQTVVFGNKGETSGTGVAPTRNSSIGRKEIYGEYLINAQGEDVAAGAHTPQPISKLVEDLPKCYEEFMNLAMKLESHFCDMQDMEFTIEERKLYSLQTRNGKGTAPATIQTVCDLVDEEMITPEEAVCRVEAKPLDQLLHLTFAPEALKAGEVIESTLPTSPGAIAGKVYFIVDGARDAGKGDGGEGVILVRLETSPENIEDIHTAQGILAIRGGMTSHAIVAAYSMGTCYVPDCGEIKIDEEAKVFGLGGYTSHEGDYISPDGSAGRVYEGDIATQEAIVSSNFEGITGWADKFRALRVRINADTLADILNAVKLGAEGIGLCHIKHMFLDAEGIPKVRKTILSETVEQGEEVLDELIPFQKGDFKAMFKALEGRLMTIRYLGPPLHEFIPIDPEDIRALAEDVGITVEAIKDKCADLYELNSVVGHRGCRLAVTYPETARMQTRTIMEVAIEVKEECGYDIVPEVMILSVNERREPKFVKNIVIRTAELVKKEKNSDIQHHIGTMIEIPEAILAADKVAEEARLFSFGVNDLTQMTFGFLRDDAGKFLDFYYKAKICESDPFARPDRDDAGQLVKTAVERGHSIRADLGCGIYGEYGGDPSFVESCHKIGLNYVSYSPSRVPIARLATAQAALDNE